MRGYHWLWLFPVFLLMACSAGVGDDLGSYVQRVKATHKGKVEPLPEIRPHATYRYLASEMRDPFMPSGLLQQTSKRHGGVQPDLGRKREPLESFQVDTLRMVGIVERQSETWALISAPDGRVYQVHKGNYVGQSHGRITHISKNTVELTEIVADGMGGWIERPASLTLKD